MRVPLGAVSPVSPQIVSHSKGPFLDVRPSGYSRSPAGLKSGIVLKMVPAVASVKKLLDVWNVKSHALFQPGLLPKFVFTESFSYYRNSVHNLPHPAKNDSPLCFWRGKSEACGGFDHV